MKKKKKKGKKKRRKQDKTTATVEKCGTCGGELETITVIDSIHDGDIHPALGEALAGSGHTQNRNATYCPECDPEPKGEIINQPGIEVFAGRPGSL